MDDVSWLLGFGVTELTDEERAEYDFTFTEREELLERLNEIDRWSAASMLQATTSLIYHL